ncbi:adenine nucleotide alpha hydrolases-like protein [Xylariaceae sp. FL0594]|nr:adenine nucleotide alpha hydrolases-like protein [Xylariaceae sp. FL0594]
MAAAAAAAAPPGGGGGSSSLSVIALISGGKDSFYSIFHCQANGHRVVALANLYPSREGDDDDAETDLNSFMYQTVGHQIIPLYGVATGLPLYREAIVGGAVHHGLSYPDPSRRESLTGSSSLAPPDPEPEDETESLVPLLRTVLQNHPEANALCTGAILSTYQRTRVESVALRLGLVPLSYLWQYTELPAAATSGSSEMTKKKTRRRDAVRDDARLLREMAAAGLEARIIKVASAGLDESFLWENVTSEAGLGRVERAMRRFGGTGDRGTILGEGGEFETLVLDGPRSLFSLRMRVSDEDRRIVREGGGCSWLSFRTAHLVPKHEPNQAQGGELLSQAPDIPIPALLSPKFEDIQNFLLGSATFPPFGVNREPGSEPDANLERIPTYCRSPDPRKYHVPQSVSSQEWVFYGSGGTGDHPVKVQIVNLVDHVRRRLDDHALRPNAITGVVIVLRRMSDFPLVNEHYGPLFDEPNPPSRVTISCGDELLPADATVCVYLTVQLSLQPHERRGLHVQSRSYWAPANIGPYSQAVAYPLLPLSTPEMVNEAADDGTEEENYSTTSVPLAVSIAGQIPLVPASMELLAASTPDCGGHGIILALQHLWRIGVEMQVRWWTSAVAYFPAAPCPEVMRRQAMLAEAAWQAAHTWPQLEGLPDEDGEDSEDEEDDGPDLWDRRHNPQFMTYGGGDEDGGPPLPLPDWSVLEMFDPELESKQLLEMKLSQMPAFFAAEVEELPRQAGVEWHAHLGIAEVRSGCISLYSRSFDDVPSLDIRPFRLALQHVAVRVEHGLFIQTTAMAGPPSSNRDEHHDGASKEMLEAICSMASISLESLFELPTPLKPKVTYARGLEITGRDEDLGDLGALIPCRSLWGSRGLPLSAVCIFETQAVRLK